MSDKDQVRGHAVVVQPGWRAVLLAAGPGQRARGPGAPSRRHALRGPVDGLPDRRPGRADPRALARRPGRAPDLLPRARAGRGRRREPSPHARHGVLPRRRRPPRDPERERRGAGPPLGRLPARARALLRGDRPAAPGGRARALAVRPPRRRGRHRAVARAQRHLTRRRPGHHDASGLDGRVHASGVHALRRLHRARCRADAAGPPAGVALDGAHLRMPRRPSEGAAPLRHRRPPRVDHGSLGRLGERASEIHEHPLPARRRRREPARAPGARARRRHLRRQLPSPLRPLRRQRVLPRSTFLVQRRELEAARDPAILAAKRYIPSPEDFDHPLDYRPVDGRARRVRRRDGDAHPHLRPHPRAPVPPGAVGRRGRTSC